MQVFLHNYLHEIWNSLIAMLEAITAKLSPRISKCTALNEIYFSGVSQPETSLDYLVPS